MIANDAGNQNIDLSVVVPIYNEEDMLLESAEQLAPHLDEIVGKGRWQFVMVDNGSTDRSPTICEEIMRRWPTSRTIRLRNPDYGEALYQGLTHAQAPWAFLINVDFWDIPFLRWCYETRGAYDLVMGSKRADMALNEQTAYRRILSWGLNVILQEVFGFVGSDTHGQKFIFLPTLRPIFQQSVMRRGQFDTEFALRASRARLWLAEVPVPVVELRKSRNLMLNKIARNVVDILKLRRILKKVPVVAAARYHRWSREDVVQLSRKQTELVLELGRIHRNARALALNATIESTQEEPTASDQITNGVVN